MIKRFIKPVLLSFILLLVVQEATVLAEYGDKVIDNYASGSGMRPVVFPHWVHRARVKCKVCHEDLGFKFQLNANKITMADIAAGKYCGACHNNKIAWAASYCDRCHSGVMPQGKPLMPGSQTLP